jgi:NDP-sugar pyrophosphorylase family protein
MSTRNNSCGFNHALIMAAGRGNRLKPLTDILPKALLPVGDGTLIGHSLNGLKNAVQAVHVTVGYKSNLLAPYLLEYGVSTLINTAGKPNSWWIANSLLSQVDEPILVLTCDNITELDGTFLRSEYERIGSPACMLVPVAPIPGIEGDFIHSSDGRVIRVSRSEPAPIYCTGIQVLNPRRVAQRCFCDSCFYGVWNQLIDQGELAVSRPYPHRWFSIDSLDQLAMFLERAQYGPTGSVVSNK